MKDENDLIITISFLQQVRVIIEDENDNRPVWIFPGSSNQSLTVFIPVQRDATLFSLHVVDADKGDNSKLTYSMMSANLTSLFFRR